jgi:hypothetical protein
VFLEPIRLPSRQSAKAQDAEMFVRAQPRSKATISGEIKQRQSELPLLKSELFPTATSPGFLWKLMPIVIAPLNV